MKLFKHEHKAAEPEAVALPDPPTNDEPVPVGTEPAAAPQAFGRMTERQDDGDLVIIAELPGLDPDNDVELSVSDGLLHIEAQHREESTTEDDGFVHREVFSARFLRTLPLPAGVSADDIKATFEGGTLEVRVPAAASTPETPTATKIPITTS